MPPELTIPAPTAAPRRPVRWPLVYYLLAAFDLLAITGSLYLGHQVMGIFRNSVEINQQWAARLSDLSEIARAAGDVNAPGNDVFDTLDQDGESARQKRALAAFNVRIREFSRAVEATGDETERGPLRAAVDEIAFAMAQMVDEANLIFMYFRANEPEAAGRRMATMDRKFAALNEIGRAHV